MEAKIALSCPEPWFICVLVIILRLKEEGLLKLLESCKAGKEGGENTKKKEGSMKEKREGE